MSICAYGLVRMFSREMWKSTIESPKKGVLWFLFQSAVLTDAKNIEWNETFHYKISVTNTLFYHDDLVLVVLFLYFITAVSISLSDTVILDFLDHPGAFKNI